MDLRRSLSYPSFNKPIRAKTKTMDVWYFCQTAIWRRPFNFNVVQLVLFEICICLAILLCCSFNLCKFCLKPASFSTCLMHYITPRVKGFVKMDFVKMSLYNKWIIAYEHYFEGSGDILLHVRVGVYEYWQAWCRGQTNEILSQRSVRDQRLFFIISNQQLYNFLVISDDMICSVFFCRVQSEGPDRSGVDSLICFCTTNPCPFWCHRR